MPDPFIGAVLDPHNGYWRLTADQQLIIDAPSEHVIFATNLRDLEAELKLRRPVDSHPQVAHHFVEQSWDSRGTLTEKLAFTGTDAQVLCDILVNDPELNVRGLAVQDHVLRDHLSKHHLKYNLVVRDCHFMGCFRYDPQAAKKQIKRIAYNKKRLGIGVQDVFRVNFGLHRTLTIFLPLDDPHASGWYDAIRGMSLYVGFFNQVFGKYAHRRFDRFQELTNKWKEADEMGKRRIRSFGVAFKRFADWLDKETKAKRPPVITEWKPKSLDFPFDAW